MPDHDPVNTQEDSPASTLFRLTCILAIAFGLYALSPGPVAKWLQPRTFNAFLAPSPLDQAIHIAYAPLGYCYEHSPAIHRLYAWYINDVWHAGP